MSKTGKSTPIVAVVLLAGISSNGAPNLIATDKATEMMVTRSKVLIILATQAFFGIYAGLGVGACGYGAE